MRYQVTIRYGILRNVENAFTQIPALKKGDKVVIRSFRGVEFGVAISQPQELDDEAVVSNMAEVLHKITEEEEEKQKEIEEEIIPSDKNSVKEKKKNTICPINLPPVEN